MRSRCKTEPGIFKRAGEPLDWPMKVGGRGIGENAGILPESSAWSSQTKPLRKFGV